MKVVAARTLDEALTALAGATNASKILAGGTDLVVEMESGRTRPDFVLDVGRVRELRWIRATDAGVEIGAGTTCADIARSSELARHADLLVECAREVGAVQIQNRATIGGNLGTASPAADLVPVLFALGARVRLRSLAGARELAIEDFVTGYRTTARRDDELIESVALPRRPAGERRAFRKVGTRRAQSISKVVVALALCPRGTSQRGTNAGRTTSRGANAGGADPRSIDARIAAGSVAECTVRLRALERALAAGLEPAAVSSAVRLALAHDIRPRDDVRSTALYRRTVLERLLTRLITDLLAT